MTMLVQVALYGWIPLVLVMFVLLKPRVAVATAFAAGWCFLPLAGFRISGLPDFDKTTATSFGALLGTVVFHTWVFANFRPKLIDFPMLIWCICPMFSSLSNDLGWYDGVTAAVDRCVEWGLPYFIGRLHFTQPRHLKDLATPIIVCALIYVPLCFYELRMSPQLHRMVYGFFPHGFRQHVRYGGYRPIVFMSHGLQVAIWLASALVLCTSLWIFGRQKRFSVMKFAIPLMLITLSLAVTLVLVKSLGALALAIVGIGVLSAAAIFRNPLPIVGMALVCVFYLGGRSTDLWTGDIAIQAAATINEERGRSLEFRFINETMLADKARERVIFGWGGWGRNRVYDEYGNDISVVDGLWIIAFGLNGIVGLVSLYGAMLIGPTLLAIRIKPQNWATDSNAALASGFSVVCLMAAADSLPNAMTIPVITMALGAVSGVSTSRFTRPANEPVLLPVTA